MDGSCGFALLPAESRCTTLPREVLATWPYGVAALADLNTAHLVGIALEVFPTEPYPADGPLLAHPHIVATAHTASHTSDYSQPPVDASASPSPLTSTINLPPGSSSSPDQTFSAVQPDTYRP